MRRRGFTYLELMMVIAMIAILAAIAVPNFLEAQVRTKVARAHADMATLVAALEDYRMDHHAYPPNLPWVDQALGVYTRPASGEGAAAQAASPERRASGPYGRMYASSTEAPWATVSGLDVYVLMMSGDTALSALTSPTQYLGSLPDDTFQRVRGMPHFYVNWENLSGGGLRLDEDGPLIPALLVSPGPDNGLDISYPTNEGYVAYDPTNGTVSGGDLVEYPR